MLDWLKDILGDAHTEDVDKLVSAKIGELFVSRDDFNTTNTNLKAANDKVTTLTGQLSAAEKTAQAAGTLQKDLDAANATIGSMKKGAAIREGLSRYKPHDADTVMRLLDADKITLAEDGTLQGLAEQLTPLKESKGFLFTDTPDTKGGADLRSAPAAPTMNDFIRGGN